MRKFILTFLLTFVIAFSSRADNVKIAALINGEIISSEDMNNQINIFMLNSPIPLNAETRGMITRRVLAQTIEQKLKLQTAQKNDIKVSDDEVKNQLQIWAKNNHISLNNLSAKKIDRQALSDNIKAELAWVKFIRKKYYQTANITQTEIDETINEITQDMSIKKYQVLEIYIKKENARDIQTLVAKLREDPRFELYAARFSDAPSAANGGNLGWINSGKMLSALEVRLAKMRIDEVSDAILIGDGYYILKLLQVFDPQQNKGFAPDQNEVRTLLENQKMEALSKKMLQEIKQKAIIEIKKS
ncbi:MAG: peptidylprolyl isomerase [Alphaproteobacteria bacterium]|nr:peptidylprolyl isomerase [Alphaproteobacteria bacterium]MBQ9235276.1 peptidylprolyl isomerase [Alphaproteobacteria bacterium]